MQRHFVWMPRFIGMKNRRKCSYWTATCIQSSDSVLFFNKVWCFHGSKINNSELWDVALCTSCEIYQGFEGFAKSVFGDVPWRHKENNSSERLEFIYQPAWRCISSGPRPRLLCLSSFLYDEILLWKATKSVLTLKWNKISCMPCI